MKIYISLPITGYDLQERKQYAENVRSRLQQIYTDGEIITPFDVCTDPSLPYEELIGKDTSCLTYMRYGLCMQWKQSQQMLPP